MESLINQKEKVYFVISLIISLLIYTALIVSVIGISWLAIGFLIGLIAQGLFIGYIQGNAVRVNEQQFPDIHKLVRELAAKIDLQKIPDIYILQAGGFLNAFATKFLSRNFVVIYSEIMELAWEEGEDALAFVIAHELSHIKRKHLSRQWLLYPSRVIPFLAQAYSRACEYTADQFGAHLRPQGAISGLLILALGKKLYKKANLQEYLNQPRTECGFWVNFSELLSTHPNLPKRLNAVNKK